MATPLPPHHRRLPAAPAKPAAISTSPAAFCSFSVSARRICGVRLGSGVTGLRGDGGVLLLAPLRRRRRECGGGGMAASCSSATAGSGSSWWEDWLAPPSAAAAPRLSDVVWSSAGFGQKYNMFIAQVGCAAFGVLALSIFGPGWLARSTALAASVAFMITARAIHPPAASLPILFIDGAKFHNLHFWYALFPGATGCILLCLIQELVDYLKENYKF